MLEVNLIFEVHCQRPPWGIINPISKFTDSRYRVYVDDDLITERSWTWDSSIFLRESVWIKSAEGYDHILKIEPVVYIPEQAVFSVDNFKVANVPATSTKINDLQVNFTLR
jgi:hypothetical protein